MPAFLALKQRQAGLRREDLPEIIDKPSTKREREHCCGQEETEVHHCGEAEACWPVGSLSGLPESR
jgi:hypothetical protein